MPIRSNGFDKQRKEEHLKASSKGGKANAQKKKEKTQEIRTIQEIVKQYMAMGLKDGDLEKIENFQDAKTKNLSVKSALVYSAIAKALKGDMNAFKIVVDLLQEQNVDNNLSKMDELLKTMKEIADK